MGTNLYIGNLSFETTEESLRQAFSTAGRVSSCSLIMDRYTGKSRGFAFVEMGTEEEAQAAIRDLGGKELDGRMIRVTEARPREDRGDRGNRGDGRDVRPRGRR